MIHIKDVHRSFDQHVVLRDLNWVVPTGTIYGLVGPNGAGKSTLLRCIAGVLPVDSGLVTVFDQAVYDNPEVKKDIFFVSDEPFFFQKATIKEMKEFYTLFYPRFNDSFYHHLLKKFGLDENMNVSKFSKGMKRQASLILAMSCSPKLLLLDEAFDGLDPVMRLTLKRILADELLNREFTVIISSHNLRELEDICDHIAMLSNQTISIQDEIEDLRTQYHKLQCAYAEEVDDQFFNDLKPLYYNRRGKVITLVLKGNIEGELALIKQTKPLLLEEIPITMEEVFVYEMEAEGYGKAH